KIQQRYGYQKDQAEKEVTSCAPSTSPQRELPSSSPTVSLPIRTLARFIRGIGSPDLANPFLDLAGNGVRSVPQLSLDEQLLVSINTVLHRVCWRFHSHHVIRTAALLAQASLRGASIVPARSARPETRRAELFRNPAPRSHTCLFQGAFNTT